MSVINNALSDLASKQNNQQLYLQKADVPIVPRSKSWLWGIVGFSLSLGAGGWAVSLQENPTQTPIVEMMPNVLLSSTPSSTLSSPTTNVESAQVKLFKPSPKIAQINNVTSNNKQSVLSTGRVLNEEIVTANKVRHSLKSGGMRVTQVELTPAQLADKAITEAEKALDDNDLNSALENYSIALRYIPSNEVVRQKLAALYYGKKDPRRAFELLEAGIKQNNNSETLRLSLSKMLLKEKQSEAALTPLVFLPPEPSVDYLSMRAGLAQQIKQTNIALESYQLLTEKDGDNARWWLGLGIQQERNMEPKKAKEAYQQALNRVGLSSQTKQFVQRRLELLSNTEEKPSATD